MTKYPENQYLRFEELPPDPNRKTKIVNVRATGSGNKLGSIRWWGPWRQYTFHPMAATVFNKGCLNTINEAIDVLMAERKEKV